MAFKLFQSIFGGGGDDAAGKYPESLIELATERVVDGVYPRLRVLPGYKKRLRQPVIQAIDHVIALVDGLSAAAPASSSDYGKDARVRALFISPENMREVYGQDPVLAEFRTQQAAGVERVTALLLAERKEKNVLGIELSGNQVSRDVAQVTVSFGKHRLLDPHPDEAEARRQLKHRAFDHLITLALNRIAEARIERSELNRQRDLMKSKSAALKRGGCGFEAGGGESVSHATLQQELDAIEAQLDALPVDDRTLEGQLDAIADVFLNAREHFWTEDIELCLDRMNVKRNPGDESAEKIAFKELANSRGQRLATLLVTLRLDELPQRKSFAENADRMLAELGGSTGRKP